MRLSKRFAIGTLVGGEFQADTLCNDPELSTFHTLEEAISQMEELIEDAASLWGSPLTNGAIKDYRTDQVVWIQRN